MAKTRKSGQLVKTSTFIKEEFSVFEKEIVSAIVAKANITEKEALTFLKTDENWQALMEMKRKSLDLDMLELVDDFKAAVKKKTENGSLEQAKAGMTGIAIAYDKVFGKLAKKDDTMFKSDNINVKMDFHYKGYKRKGVKKT